LDIPAGGEATLKIPFVVPYERGEYEVSFFGGAGVPLGKARFSVGE
jgi:hypothetical protein